MLWLSKACILCTPVCDILRIIHIVKNIGCVYCRNKLWMNAMLLRLIFMILRLNAMHDIAFGRHTVAFALNTNNMFLKPMRLIIVVCLHAWSPHGFISILYTVRLCLRHFSALLLFC